MAAILHLILNLNVSQFSDSYPTWPNHSILSIFRIFSLNSPFSAGERELMIRL